MEGEMKGRIVGHGDNTRYYIDGKEVTRREFNLSFPDRPIGNGSGLMGWKPLHSVALGVHPAQITEAVADAKAKGVPTEFDTEGDPVFTSRRHRKEYLKAYGFRDRNGGYGD